MRKGFLWTTCTMLAVAGSVPAQQWPFYPSPTARSNMPVAPAGMSSPALPMQAGFPGAYSPAAVGSVPGVAAGAPLASPEVPYWQVIPLKPIQTIRPSGDSNPMSAVRKAGGEGAMLRDEAPGVAVRADANGGTNSNSTTSILPVKKEGVECDVPVDIIDGDGSCYDDGDGHKHGGGNGRFYHSAEYLLYWTKSGPLPFPLISTGTAASQGILSNPGAVPAFFPEHFQWGATNGGRLTTGFWFAPQQQFGIEATGFLLEQRADSFQGVSGPAGAPVISSPFINALTGAEAVTFIALPGQNSGDFLAIERSQVWSGEFNFVRGLSRTGKERADFLLGFRYMNLDESLDIIRNTSLLPGITVPFNGGTVGFPQRFRIADAFDTRNQFYGGTLGLRYETAWDRLCLSMLAKASIGSTHQVIDILGNTSAQGATGAATIVSGGLLALNSNIGRHTQNRMTGIPEGEFKIGYHLSRHILASLGYNFIYWSSVVRPGDQLSRTINPTALPTSALFVPNSATASPLNPFHKTDYWIQGISVGLSVIF